MKTKTGKTAEQGSPAKGDPDKGPWTYKAWYTAHAADLAERRRKKYEEDPEYKRKVLEQNRLYRERKAKEESARPKPMIRIPKRRKPVVCMVPINGVLAPRQLVHIGEFARTIQRSVSTIHQWERAGVLPKTPFFVSGKGKQERLYTAEMIGVVKKVLELRNGTASVADSTFPRDIIQGWRGAGIDADVPHSVVPMVANG